MFNGNIAAIFNFDFFFFYVQIYEALTTAKEANLTSLDLVEKIYVVSFFYLFLSLFFFYHIEINLVLLKAQVVWQNFEVAARKNSFVNA